MHQKMSHTDYLSPGKFRMGLPKFVSKFISSLSNNLSHLCETIKQNSVVEYIFIGMSALGFLKIQRHLKHML